VSNPTSRFGSIFFGKRASNSPSPTGLTLAAQPHVLASPVRVLSLNRKAIGSPFEFVVAG
ncbi:MAG TPA: hypothetical protein DIU35_11250, partial [Candidatus Latescibacteria bacterium]|nr:hypothetical protein [Candidatus Latescibacterota bacterium]